MEVFLAALVLVGFGVLGMCFNIIFRKNGQFPQTDVGSNENMKKLGIRCMREEDDDPASNSNDLGFNIGARPDASAKEDQAAEEPEYK